MKEHRIDWEQVRRLAEASFFSESAFYRRFKEGALKQETSTPVPPVERAHIAVLVRFYVYKVLGPKGDDEAYCAMADLLMAAYSAAWAHAHGHNREDGKFQPSEIIGVPDTNIMCFLRGCKYLERACAGWPKWDGSPAQAFLNEMQLAAIPHLERWTEHREEFTQKWCDDQKSRVKAKPGSGVRAEWYGGADKIESPLKEYRYNQRPKVEDHVPQPMEEDDL